MTIEEKNLEQSDKCNKHNIKPHSSVICAFHFTYKLWSAICVLCHLQNQ